MLLYNKLYELVLGQFLILAVVEALLLAFGIAVMKPKITAKKLVAGATATIVLSLLSIAIVRGHYGGTLYHENFGWPIQYRTVSRSIEPGDINEPYSMRFDLKKFLANSIIWAFVPFVLLELCSVPKDKRRKFVYFPPAAIIIFAALIAYFSHQNANIDIMELMENDSIPKIIIPEDWKSEK